MRSLRRSRSGRTQIGGAIAGPTGRASLWGTATPPWSGRRTIRALGRASPGGNGKGTPRGRVARQEPGGQPDTFFRRGGTAGTASQPQEPQREAMNPPGNTRRTEPGHWLRDTPLSEPDTPGDSPSETGLLGCSLPTSQVFRAPVRPLGIGPVSEGRNSPSAAEKKPFQKNGWGGI